MTAVNHDVGGNAGFHQLLLTDVHTDGIIVRPTTATAQHDMTVGVAAANRHEAMTLGEAGADYVWFGETATLLESAAELACWWTRLFEVPAVLAGPADDASLALMIATIPFVFLLLGFSFLLMMAGSNFQTVGQVLIALMGIFVLFYAVGLFVGRFRPAGVAGQKSGNIFS